MTTSNVNDRTMTSSSKENPGVHLAPNPRHHPGAELLPAVFRNFLSFPVVSIVVFVVVVVKLFLITYDNAKITHVNARGQQMTTTK